MNVKQSGSKAEGVLLDRALHAILDDVAAARVAAMQVLVFHLQVGWEERQDIPPDAFLAAVHDICTAPETLKTLEKTHLMSVGVSLPSELTEKIDEVTADLSTLMHVLDRCSQSEKDGIKGFKGRGYV